MLSLSRLYVSAAGAATRPTVTEGLLMAILLAHHKKLDELGANFRSFSKREDEGGREQREAWEDLGED